MASSSKILAAIGPKGSGKSYWAKGEIRKAKRRTAIFDMTGEYKPGRGREQIPGLVRHASVRAFLAEARKGRMKGKHAVAGSYRDFSAFCAFLYASRDWLAVFEELTALGPELAKSRPFRDIENRSRHAGLDLLLIGHRPTSLPPTLRNQVDQYVVFGTSEPRDLGFWSERAGDPKVAERVRALGKYKHLTL